MSTKYPCNICNNPVAKNHKAIKYYKCQLWVHIKCNKVNVQTHNLLIEDETTWYCISCSKETYPFSSLNDSEFHKTIQGKKIKFLTVAKKRSRNENTLLNKLSDAINDENIDNASSYFDESDFNKNFPKNLFDGSLCRNFDDLHTLLSEINLKFDIIGITETRLKKNSIRNINIDLKGYTIEHTPTEANCGGALLYINNTFNHTVRNDLRIYQKKRN